VRNRLVGLQKLMGYGVGALCGCFCAAGGRDAYVYVESEPATVKLTSAQLPSHSGYSALPSSPPARSPFTHPALLLLSPYPGSPHP
jgi:hypothetical protein